MPTLQTFHKPTIPGSNKIRVQSKDDRHTSSKRGYGAAWRKLRSRVMSQIALRQGWPYTCCEHCLKKGTRTRATDLDHVISRRKGGMDSPDNLQALCHSCHTIKTNKEDMGR